METERKRYLHVSFSLFKSYYVVWKHNLEVVGDCINISFKSYYVVWKLSSSAAAATDFFCLNRTM